MLDKQSTKILKFIFENGKTSIEEICNKFSQIDDITSYVTPLKNNYYLEGLKDISGYTSNYYTGDIKFTSSTTGPYKITTKGIAYLESTKQDVNNNRLKTINQIINTIISVSALVIAILSYIKQ